MIERVLLAVDDSAGSVAAVRAAVELAAACGAAIDVVTVLGDAVAAEALATASSSGQVLRRRERAATALLRHAAEAADRAAVPVHTVQLCGEPARHILAEARRCHADLIVVGRGTV
jgi:nucleotide-binding universal stress UspA family protein